MRDKRQSFLVFLILLSLISVNTSKMQIAAAQIVVPQSLEISDPLFDQRIALGLNMGPALFLEMTRVPRWDFIQNAALDTGCELTHPDLAGQIREDLSIDLLNDNLSRENWDSHGIGMQGFLVAHTNGGGYIASPCGLGHIQGVDIRWNNGVVGFPGKVRDGLRHVLAKNQEGGRIATICFASGIQDDDDPKETKKLVLQLQNQKIGNEDFPTVIYTTNGGMIGKLASDPEVQNVATVSSMAEDGQGFDPLSGAGPDAMLSVPGGLVHQLAPRRGGTGPGFILTGGVSVSIALAASCGTAVCQWGLAKNSLKALEALKATARPFPGSEGHVLGCIDLYAAMNFDPDAPVIKKVTFNGKKKVTITGNNFDPSTRVFINDLEVTSRITSASSKVIKIKDKPSKLGLQPGQNKVKVMTQDETSTSNLFILTL